LESAEAFKLSKPSIVDPLLCRLTIRLPLAVESTFWSERRLDLFGEFSNLYEGTFEENS